MEPKPLVSIVMPVYNAMPYLEQAIRSIYAQTVTDWELIAVDDRRHQQNSGTEERATLLEEVAPPRLDQ